MRSAAIQKIELFGDDEENKDIIIEALVYLKDKMKAYSSGSRQQMQQPTEYEQQHSRLSLPLSQQFEADQSIEEPENTVPRDVAVLDLIDRDFEKGLVLLKELVKDEQTGDVQLSFEKKERIISKLLLLTTRGYANP